MLDGELCREHSMLEALDRYTTGISHACTNGVMVQIQQGCCCIVGTRLDRLCCWSGQEYVITSPAVEHSCRSGDAITILTVKVHPYIM